MLTGHMSTGAGYGQEGHPGYCQTVTQAQGLGVPHSSKASLIAQLVKNLPAMQETLVRILGRDFLEKEMATHSSILAWRISWIEEPHWLQSMGSQELDTT